MTDSGDSSSSSEDEAMKEALREATDSQFLKKSLFADHKGERCVDNDSSDAKGHVQKFDEFGVSVGFKDFVAKKLFDFLDRNLGVEETSKKPKKSKKRKAEDCQSPSGIKLLSSSTTLLTTVEEDPQSFHCTSKPKKKLKDISSKDDIERCREAAVDPEWVISKRETEHWSERRRGTVFEYKTLPNGTLVAKP